MRSLRASLYWESSRRGAGVTYAPVLHFSRLVPRYALIGLALLAGCTVTSRHLQARAKTTLSRKETPCCGSQWRLNRPRTEGSGLLQELVASVHFQ